MAIQPATEPKLPLVTPARVIAAFCVVVPFIAVLTVPIYDKAAPDLAGFPFFFWWQLAWVVATAALMGLAYYVIRKEELARKAAVQGSVAAQGSVADPTDPGASADPTDPAAATDKGDAA